MNIVILIIALVLVLLFFTIRFMIKHSHEVDPDDAEY